VNALRVAIVGCGAVGTKRSRALGTAELVACVDTELSRAQQLAATAHGCLAVARVTELDPRMAIDVAIVSTTHDALAETASQMLQRGCHVLLEKPAARTLLELAGVERDARAAHRLVRVGFNHRYHPALARAKQIVDAGELGPLMFVRGRYGHGGRVGYDREWRADPELSGGGALIDQGVHLIDLASWFLGDAFTKVDGFADTFFWNMPVDDNAFLTLRTANGKTAFLHVSASEWKNLFSLEIYGRLGKLHVEGLGGSYGVERLTWHRMFPEMGPPQSEVWEYPGPDTSWAIEFAEFTRDIAASRSPRPGLAEARVCLETVAAIYDHRVVG